MLAAGIASVHHLNLVDILDLCELLVLAQVSLPETLDAQMTNIRHGYQRQ